MHSSPTTATSIPNLKVVKFCLESLDRAVRQLQVLVQAIALRYQLHRRSLATSLRRDGRYETHVLLPLSEACLLGLDLLREPPAKLFLFLLELRVVELLHLALTVLARLHLLLAVVLIVTFLRGRDKVEHEGANEEGAQLAEVAVILIFHCASASTLLMKSQKAQDELPSATPHRYSRPFTTRPSWV